jgi:hypothetical protein
MILRNTTTGGLEVYDISNNQITGAAFMGASLDWQVAGFGNFSSNPSETDMLLRNPITGGFEVYDIANNQLTGAGSLGAVGLDWQIGCFAGDPPTAASGGLDGSASQLVQAMASFGGGSGAGESLDTVPLGADTSQQPLLTTPHA